MNSALLGQRIRQAREDLGLSQSEFAQMVAKDQRAISDYENGKRKVSAIDLAEFAQALQVPASYFFEGEQELSDWERIILQELNRLDDIRARQALIKIVRAFVDYSIGAED